jgi:hypothetical protein
MRDSEKSNKMPLFGIISSKSTIEFRAPGTGLTKFPDAKTCQFKKLGWLCDPRGSLGKPSINSRQRFVALQSDTLYPTSQLGEKDEGFTTEEEQEEAIRHTAEAQDASKDVEMGF